MPIGLDTTRKRWNYNWRSFDLAETVSRCQWTDLCHYLIRMQRTSPVFQNRWNGERRIQAVNMPVEWTNAARNDGSHICGGFLTPMADYCLSLIALLEEVWHLFIAILSPEVYVSMFRYAFLAKAITHFVDLRVVTSSYSPSAPALTPSKRVCNFLGRLKARGMLFSRLVRGTAKIPLKGGIRDGYFLYKHSLQNHSSGRWSEGIMPTHSKWNDLGHPSQQTTSPAAPQAEQSSSLSDT
jgi:hypothetical protein